VRYVGTPTPTGLVRAAVPEAVHGPGRVQAWVVGPGLDVSSRAAGAGAQLDAARAALAGAEPVVVDAGGLDLLDADLLEARADAVTLLTPHAGECARLLTRLGGVPTSTDRSLQVRPGVPTSTDRSLQVRPGVPTSTDRSLQVQGEVTREQVEARPLAHARALAELTGATVLLKGATTLVVPPGRGAPVWSQSDAPAWLATAGAGDVLAGLLGTLLAAGLPADLAGALGALVHGVAADRANPGGPVRALAVAHGIPAAVAHLVGRSRPPAS
jgi:NAD(P)H-hydrate repair Nnr-like enzyme with NAD(P)H-hydrate dehydratase domain